MILILGGIIFLSKDITTLDTASTTRTDIESTMAGFNCTVIASAEQMPSTCMVIGLLCPNGSLSNFRFLAENKGSFSLIAKNYQ
jgi:hypothetical protein